MPIIAFKSCSGWLALATIAAAAAAGCSTASKTTSSASTPQPRQAVIAMTKNVGYTNTPIIPGTKWHVHDGLRPQPRIVTPGATFSHLAPPPSDAVVLFNGTDLAKWAGPDGAAKWKVENGYMEVAPKSGGIRTRDKFAD